MSKYTIVFQTSSIMLGSTNKRSNQASLREAFPRERQGRKEASSKEIEPKFGANNEYESEVLQKMTRREPYLNQEISEALKKENIYSNLAHPEKKRKLSLIIKQESQETENKFLKLVDEVKNPLNKNKIDKIMMERSHSVKRTERLKEIVEIIEKERKLSFIQTQNSYLKISEEIKENQKRLKKQLKDQKEEKEKYQQMLRQIREELERQKSSVKKYQQEKVEVQAVIERLQRSIAEPNQQNQRLNRDLHQISQQNQQLTKEKEQKQKLLQESHMQIEKLTLNTIKPLQAQLRSQEQQIQRFNRLIAESNQQNQRLNKDLHQISQQNQQLTKEKEQKQKLLQESHMQIKKLTLNTIKPLQAQLRSKEQQIQRFNRSIAESNQQNQRLNRDLHYFSQQKQQLTKEKEQKQKLLQESHMQIKKLTLNTIKPLQAQLRSKEQQIQWFNRSIAESNQQNQRLNKDLHQFSQQNQQFAICINQLKHKIFQRQKQMKHLSCICKQYQQTLQQFTKISVDNIRYLHSLISSNDAYCHTSNQSIFQQIKNLQNAINHFQRLSQHIRHS